MPESRRRTLALVALLGCALVGCNDSNPNAPSRADVAQGASSPVTSPATPFVGTWEGTFAVNQCTGTGSVQDVTCRQRYPSTARTLMSLRLSGEGSNVRGRLTLGEIEGPVAGVIEPGGTLSLTGTLTDEVLRLNLRSWDTKIQNGQMDGRFTFRALGRVLPGQANAQATIRVLGRVN